MKSENNCSVRAGYTSYTATVESVCVNEVSESELTEKLQEYEAHLDAAMHTQTHI